MEALVTKSTGSWYFLLDEKGNVLRGRIRGKMRLGDTRKTNPVAVGDRVEILWEEEPDLVIIQDVLPRRNYIVRKSNNLSKQSQVIAANIDMAVLLVTMAAPFTSTGFIDRFLVTAEAYHIPTLIVFNKTDIYNEEALHLMKVYKEIYENAGYETLAISAITNQNLDALREKLEGKVTLFSGHSGVGKSTLLNAFYSGVQQKTGEISDYSMKGKHTTTFAEMFHLNIHTHIIDTPGIKDFGVVDLDKSELAHYFIDMKRLLGQCRFHNCLHLEEPGCAVKLAVENNEISPSRYYSYLSIINNEDVHH